MLDFHTTSRSSSGSAPRVFIAAGEPSSDFHASRLILELTKLRPDVSVFGMGGSALRAAGVETIVDSETSASIMGFSELAGSLKKIIRSFRFLVSECEARRPDLAILVDYPDFNLRLAKKLHGLGIPVLYFISPQLWAWRSGRVKHMKRYVTKVATIFPFEESFYHQHGVPAEYVGHPLIETLPSDSQISAYSERVSLDRSRPILALLPGSRHAEISRLLPVLRDAAELVRQKFPSLQVVLPVAPGLSLDAMAEEYRLDPQIFKLTQGGARELMACATVAVVASGTATVEAALAGVPSIVVYRLSKISYRIAKLLVRGVKNFAMPNLICGEKVVEELLQDEVTPERISDEIEALLNNPSRLSAAREKLKNVRKKLTLESRASGEGLMTSAQGLGGESLGAGARAARIALEIMSEREASRRVG